ncbi:MAG: hypothetical protein QXQ90_09870 [Desulfurococcaceae archaeon]
MTKVYLFGDPEIVVDASAVPEPLRVYTYLTLVNLFTSTVYPRITLVNAPSWITPYTFNPSSISANRTSSVQVFFDASPSQTPDFQNNGEVETNLVWLVQFFQDSQRTQLLSQAFVSVRTIFINPLHSSWTRVFFMPFEPGSFPYEDDLVYYNITRPTTIIDADCSKLDSANSGISSARYTSPYYSYRLCLTANISGHIRQHLNIKQNYSKCFIVFDLYSSSSYFTIKRGTTPIKHCASPFVVETWVSFAFRVFSGWNYINFGVGQNLTAYIDDVTVICK